MMKRVAKSGFIFFSLGLLLVFFLNGSGIQVPTGTWVPSGNMAEARSGASSVLLQDGTLMVAGGENPSGALASVEFFSAGSFASAPAMNVARSRHAAVVLEDGRVLVTGGKTTGGGVTNAAEIYSQALNSWIVIGSMADARSGHTAVLLKGGRVLFAGGEGSAGAVATLEVFDPTTGAFALAGMMSSARKDHAAALLGDGKVLIAGGSNGSSALASTEIYDPETGAVNAGPALSTPRAGLSATTLMDGKVLIAGGNNGSADVATAETFNPATGVMSVVGSPLAATRRDHSAFLLPNNNHVLIVGGTSGGIALATTELFRPWDGNFYPTGAMSAPSVGSTGSPLGLAGLLLVAGGNGLASSELYGFATIKTDKDDYAPGELVTMTGSGWQPGETVTLFLHEINNPEPHDDLTLTAVADAAGNILNNQFAPDEHDLGIRFYLRASGANSQAQTTFTDGTPRINSITNNPFSPNQPSSVAVKDTTDMVVRNQGNGALNNVRIRIRAGTLISGTIVRELTVAASLAQNTNSAPITWDGKNTDGTFVTDGTYTARALALGSPSGASPENDGMNDKVEVLVDNTNPTVSLLAPADGATVSGNFRLEASPLDAGGNDSNIVKVEFYLDSLLVDTDTSSGGGGWRTNNINASDLSSGSHTWFAKAFDGAGNNATSASGTFNIAAPNAAPSLNAIGNKSVNEGSLLTFTATATDPNAGQTLTFSLDSGSPSGASITSGGVFTWTPTEAQGPGNYPVTIRVTDNGTPAMDDFETISIQVNEVNQAPVLGAIGNKTVDEEALLTFTAAASDSDVPANTLTFSLDAGAPSGASISSAGVFTWTPTEAQGPGDYPVTIRVTDNGTPNLNDSETVTIHVNDVNAAPVLGAIGNKTIDEETQLSFTATATDSDVPANTLTFSLEAGAPAGASITGAGVFTWTPTEAQGPGDYPVTIRVTDNGTPALNDFETISIHVSEVNKAPELTTIGDKTVDEETQLSFTAAATDADLPANTLTFSLGAGAPAGASISSAGVFTWTPTEAQGPGDYSVTLHVTDSGTPVLSDFETIDIHVSDVNAAPVIDPVGSKTVNEETVLTFTATASDSDVPANTFAFSLGAGAPAGASITSAGVFTWTPTEVQGPGDYPITIRVTDNGTPVKDDFETITVHVNEVNQAPVLAAIGNQAVDEETPLSFTATATDADLPANTLSFSLEAGAPAGASITPAGVFTWTPTEAQGPGNYSVAIRVTDNGTPALYDSETINIHVNEVNQAPVLGAIGNKTVDEESLLSFTATATDSDLNTLTYSLDSGAPAGASITSAGEFTWTPTEAQGPGDYPVTIRVTDNGTPAKDDFEMITIRVNEVNQAPVLGAIGDKTVGEETQLTFTATATDSDVPANTMTFSLDAGAPAGASITSGGVFTWTPTEGQGPGNYPVTIRVTDNGTPAKNDYETINIQVNEVNKAPQLSAIGNPTVSWGNTLSFIATASDPDLPSNTLVFSLVDAPAGASIHMNTGAFSWIPTSGQLGPQMFTVRVTDNGSPALSDEEAITVTVGPRPTQLVYSGALSGLNSNLVALKATLTDNGGEALQGTAISGRTVSFILGSQNASGSTDWAGLASTSLTLNQTAGSYSVNSSFAGDLLYSGSTGSDPFIVIQPPTSKFWIGLKNSDDQGTQFDLRAEVYATNATNNEVLVSAGETRCITNVTRNPDLAREIAVLFDPISPGSFGPGDTFSLKVFTRIGTNADGTKCSGPGGSHNNAVGLRLYYDSPSRPAKFSTQFTPNPFSDFFLHSTTSSLFLNSFAPTGVTAKFKDSSSINFNGGNLWKQIGVWSMPVP